MNGIGDAVKQFVAQHGSANAFIRVDEMDDPRKPVFSVHLLAQGAEYEVGSWPVERNALRVYRQAQHYLQNGEMSGDAECAEEQPPAELPLLPTDEQVYDFIVQFKVANDGNAPTFIEIQRALGISSTSVVDTRLNTLERAGLIVLGAPGTSRRIKLVGGTYVPPQKPGVAP